VVVRGFLLTTQLPPSLDTTMRTVPYIDKDIVEYLDKMFPNKVPDVSLTDRQIWMKVGNVEVVSFLQRLLKEQEEENILKQEVL
jgi:hypothetical protein